LVNFYKASSIFYTFYNFSTYTAAMSSPANNTRSHFKHFKPSSTYPLPKGSSNKPTTTTNPLEKGATNKPATHSNQKGSSSKVAPPAPSAPPALTIKNSNFRVTQKLKSSPDGSSRKRRGNTNSSGSSSRSPTIKKKKSPKPHSILSKHYDTESQRSNSPTRSMASVGAVCIK
jgi:hypothetical protein